MAFYACRKATARVLFFAALILFGPSHSRAETGYDAWLRYARLDAKEIAQYASLPSTVVVVQPSEIVNSAQAELVKGIRGLLGKTLQVKSSASDGGVILLATRKNAASYDKSLASSKIDDLQGDGFCLKSFESHGRQSLAIIGATDRGTLYGVFTLLRMIGTQEPVDRLDICESPAAPIRILNHWDNLDGSIERGYAGKSIFWENDTYRERFDARAGLRTTHGVGRYQRLLDQQRECRCASRDGRVSARAGSGRGSISTVGRAFVRFAELRESARCRRCKDVRSS